VLGNVGQPDAIRAVRGELAGDQVVMDRRPCLPAQAAFLAERRPDPLLGAQPGDLVLPGGDAAGRELVGDEPVAERRIISNEYRWPR
jgi:hypothetical protein